jgi:DNA-directed RNA polymerase III subunit RPC2
MLAHVPCKKFDYFPKAVYLSLMIRKLLEAVKDPTKQDDKDYYGNKRLECAGKLIGLLFEDKFKTFNSDLKKQIDKDLTRNKFNL